MPAMMPESISDVPLLEIRRSSLFQPNGEDTLLGALHDLLVHPSRRCGTALLPQQHRVKSLGLQTGCRDGDLAHGASHLCQLRQSKDRAIPARLRGSDLPS